ncbi:YdcH family protein [Xanthomonas dyei]|uniref:YdcH family protein n=1 Tax=Xanthomonas dyei TaxID=743699 RepID=UPI0032E8726E
METLSPAEIVEQIAELRRAHRALDDEIQRMPANLEDELQMKRLKKRLKKRKLQIKDCIIRLEMELVPDEPA